MFKLRNKKKSHLSSKCYNFREKNKQEIAFYFALIDDIVLRTFRAVMLFHCLGIMHVHVCVYTSLCFTFFPISIMVGCNDC